MSAVCSITTIDNPHDQFTDFRKWFLFDVEKGYNTSGLLARILEETEEFSKTSENALSIISE